MDNKVINVYKKKGETPLDCIKNIKNENKDLDLLPITYAGRLDPLAEGVLLLLVGDEVHKKDEYLKLEKVYEMDVLFGFATDTYDVMGKITDVGQLGVISFTASVLQKFIGKIKQSYPPYSSRPVKGKPLFMWAREGKLNEIEIPAHDVLIESIDIVEQKEINAKELFKKIKEDIDCVQGDFRQKEILSLWKEELLNKEENIFSIVKLRISCGSGVYVRVLANDIGKEIGVPALALNIKRIRVGEYGID